MGKETIINSRELPKSENAFPSSLQDPGPDRLKELEKTEYFRDLTTMGQKLKEAQRILKDIERQLNREINDLLDGGAGSTGSQSHWHHWSVGGCGAVMSGE